MTSAERARTEEWVHWQQKTIDMEESYGLHVSPEIKFAITAIRSLLADNEMMRKGLELYADKNNWSNGYNCHGDLNRANMEFDWCDYTDRDGWIPAVEALEGGENESIN